MLPARCTHHPLVRWSLTLLLLIAVPMTAAQAQIEMECAGLDSSGGVGPWDYSDPANHRPSGDAPKGRAKLVENVHFKPAMRDLNTKKYSPARLSGEFRYTLGIFPNHYVALNSLSKLEKHYGGRPAEGYKESAPLKLFADCYFQRAMLFKPDDARVHVVHGIHLHDRGRFSEAIKAYETAESLGEASIMFAYNFGLVLADAKQYDRALEYAQRAYGGGYPLPGLARKLEAAGYRIAVPAPARAAPTQVAPDDADAQ